MFFAGLAAVFGLGAPLHAQFTARLDLSASTRYVWHGLSRANFAAAQPSLAAGFRFKPFGIEAGVASHYELDRPRTGELSEAGVGRHHGEDDFWGRLVVDAGPLRFESGVVRYVFRGDSALGGLGPEHNTTEVYGAVSSTRAYLSPSFEAWWDVGKVNGLFLRYSGHLPVLGWPFDPYFFLYVDSELGINLGQGPDMEHSADPEHPSDLANFASRGVTHASLGPSVSLLNKPWPGVGVGSILLGLRAQLNLDDATRLSAGRKRDLIFWFWLGSSLVLGGEARKVP